MKAAKCEIFILYKSVRFEQVLFLAKIRSFSRKNFRNFSGIFGAELEMRA